ncbi:hypothetical protein SI65_06631 [Aspergillus cristatus]|uniref:Ribosome biogenesis protein Urb1 n=1 Tax=Aspergillus cristatus TaxID=573508 RepID=A0A1E3BA29_ASPCR|nr:hypothetical protein SI65_06631 [Aspergillus cristatus]
MPHFDSQSPRTKRRKLDNGQPDKSAAITSHTQLRNLLVFQQNAAEVKQGINIFKEFLLSINQTQDGNEKTKRLDVLKAFCDSQISRTGGEDDVAVCFPDLIQTWNFADSNNNESLLTVVPSVLAIFLKTVSSHLEFREFGLALCKYLLEKEQLKLFNRGMAAVKFKEHLISPCIRLLTEIVSFDGGAAARQVYSRRHTTFKRLEVFLTPNKAQLEDAEDDSSKSTLRRNAQRYVLANLRFQQASAKNDILEQHKMIRAFFEYVRKDSRDIVLDIIKASERDVAQDASLSRQAKTKFFSRWNLERLVTLYGYPEENSEGVSIPDTVHKVLMTVCTKPELGVLLPESGWYPNGSDPESVPTEDDACIELGLDSAVHVDKYRESVPVRNGTLSYLIQTLRPDVNSSQIQLLVAIFKVAPELIADYFTKKTMFIADPKPTPSWMAESALLFSTVQLRVPANCGWKDKLPAMPPPVSVVIENILPRPLTQKILTRCINQNAEIVTLFAVRILTIAFNKLRAVLKIFNADHGSNQTFWNQATDKLVAEFCRRCPAMKDVMVLYKRTDKDDLSQQEAVAELLACFYEVVPDIALEEPFDVSLVLVDILKRLGTPDLSSDDSESLLGQLQSALKIAQQSASIRWWQQPALMQYSAFTSIFKVFVDAADKDSLQEIGNLLSAVLVENSVLQSSPKSFASLLSSFEKSEQLPSQLAFFDNCVCRSAKKPVHYQDLIGSMSAEAGSVSALFAAISEQWPFVVKTGDAAAEAAVGSWIARALGKFKQAGEDTKVLKSVRDSCMEATGNKKVKSILKKALKSAEESDDEDATTKKQSKSTQEASQTPAGQEQKTDLKDIFGALPTEGTTHNALQRWEKEDLEVSVEQGRVAELMLCLCSEHEEVRRQAFTNLSRFMMKLKDSKYVEWRSVYILTGELLETVRQLGLEAPVPWIVGECASSCLSVLTNPMHKLYGKVNKFLQKAPYWEVEKIATYWVDKILLHEPELDDGYFEEINWLLDLFVKGLRTGADMEIYRRANVFERLLSFYESPSAGFSAKRRILHLLYRSTQVGGSTTLVTRAAVVSWIQSQIVGVGNARDVSTISALAELVGKSSDHERVDKWSGGALMQAVENIAG